MDLQASVNHNLGITLANLNHVILIHCLLLGIVVSIIFLLKSGHNRVVLRPSTINH
jgi:hypothetical protein